MPTRSSQIPTPPPKSVFPLSPKMSAQSNSASNSSSTHPLPLPLPIRRRHPLSPPPLSTSTKETDSDHENVDDAPHFTFPIHNLTFGVSSLQNPKLPLIDTGVSKSNNTTDKETPGPKGDPSPSKSQAVKLLNTSESASSSKNLKRPRDARNPSLSSISSLSSLEGEGIRLGFGFGYEELPSKRARLSRSPTPTSVTFRAHIQAEAPILNNVDDSEAKFKVKSEDLNDDDDDDKNSGLHPTHMSEGPFADSRFRLRPISTLPVPMSGQVTDPEEKASHGATGDEEGEGGGGNVAVERKPKPSSSGKVKKRGGKTTLTKAEKAAKAAKAKAEKLVNDTAKTTKTEASKEKKKMAPKEQGAAKGPKTKNPAAKIKPKDTSPHGEPASAPEPVEGSVSNNPREHDAIDKRDGSNSPPPGMKWRILRRGPPPPMT